MHGSGCSVEVSGAREKLKLCTDGGRDGHNREGGAAPELWRRSRVYVDGYESAFKTNGCALVG